MTKDKMNAGGALGLTMFSILLAFNQVVIKVGNDGLQPIFAAGVRSVGAAACLYLWMRWRGIPLSVPRSAVRGGLLIGLCFSAEFLCLFMALDLTTVSRSVVIFYSMPVWFAIAGHYLLPGERLTSVRCVGLCLALAGVITAMSGRSGGEASLTGDLLALCGAFAWTGIALCARATGLRAARPEMQLMWQLGMSAPILLVLSPLFGPVIRDLQPIHFAAMGFQIVVIASGGFLFWLWLMSIFPATTVAAFGLLTPVFGVVLGAVLLGDPLEPRIFAALALVVSGLFLINRRRRRDVQVPQKVFSTS